MQLTDVFLAANIYASASSDIEAQIGLTTPDNLAVDARGSLLKLYALFWFYQPGKNDWRYI